MPRSGSTSGSSSTTRSRQGGGDLLQQPVFLFHTGPGGEAGLDQPALVVEAVTGDAMQGAIGVHRVDVDEVVAFPVPQALGLDRRATAYRQRPAAVGQILG